uniref:Uncharacterized protein n=1 Tax=Oryza sativa subsp. japonica TaxID=39947 RepID=Q6ZGS8_ORYSJ|nr:hypothetical protein [Oryza sativa Japonica Group]
MRAQRGAAAREITSPSTFGRQADDEGAEGGCGARAHRPLHFWPSTRARRATAARELTGPLYS